MRILFLSNYYPPQEQGGYGQLCQEVAEGLRNRGYEVAVLTSNHGLRGGKHRNDNVFRVLNTEVDSRPIWGSINFFLKRNSRLSETIEEFQRVLTDFKPDILFVWGMWNLPREILHLAESTPGLSVVYYIADYWPTLPDAHTLHWKEPARRWYSRLPKYMLGQVAIALNNQKGESQELKFEHVICVSDAVRQRLINSHTSIESGVVIHNGIDLDPFEAARKKDTSSIRSENLQLLYAGRLAMEKGVHTIIEALADLKKDHLPVMLTIIGSGSPDYVAKLRNLSENLGVSSRVKFKGFVPREQMPEILAKFDVLIFSSIWAEPLARIVQEAMAVGLVVVGTDVGGMPEILKDGVNGLIFQPEHPSELAKCIRRLVSDENLLRKLKANAQETVENHFTLHRMLNDIEVYLQNLRDQERVSE